MYQYRSYKQTYLEGGRRNNGKGYKLLSVLLLIALIVVLILQFSGVAGLNENNYERQRNVKLRSEMQRAQASVNSLSRLGASSSSGMLGKVRQYIHGMEVINDLNVSLYGEVGRLYAQSVFDNLYAIIDDYEAKLSSGSKVSDVITTLSQAVDELASMTANMLELVEQAE